MTVRSLQSDHMAISFIYFFIYRISSNKRPGAYLKLCAKGWALIRGRALIKYFLLTNLVKHLFLTKTIVIQGVAIVQRLKRDNIGTRALQAHGYRDRLQNVT